MSACERLKKIEERLVLPVPYKEGVPLLHDDMTWLVGQVRTWQKFAARVVDFGDTLRCTPDLDSRITNGYEQLFHGN